MEQQSKMGEPLTNPGENKPTSEQLEAEQANLELEREYHGASSEEEFQAKAGYSPPFSRN